MLSFGPTNGILLNYINIYVICQAALNPAFRNKERFMLKNLNTSLSIKLKKAQIFLAFTSISDLLISYSKNDNFLKTSKMQTAHILL